MMKTANGALLRLPALGLLTLCSLAALAGCGSSGAADGPEDAETTEGAERAEGTEKTEGAESVGEVAQALRVKDGWDPLFSTPNARRTDGYQFCYGDACNNPNSYQVVSTSDCIGNPGQCSNQFSWQWQNEWVARLVAFGGYRYFGLQNTIQSAPQGNSSEVWPLLNRVKLLQVHVRGQLCGGPETYGRVPHYLQFLDPVHGDGEISVDLLSQVGPSAPVNTLAMPNPGGNWITEAELMLRNGISPPAGKWRVFEFPGNWAPAANGGSNVMSCLGGPGNVSSAPWVEYYIDVPALVNVLRNSGRQISDQARFTGSIIGGLEFWSDPNTGGAVGEVEIKSHRVYID